MVRQGFGNGKGKKRIRIKYVKAQLCINNEAIK